MTTTKAQAVASPLLASRLKREAARNWYLNSYSKDIFWKDHQNKFFHNRYWTDREFNFDELIKKKTKRRTNDKNTHESDGGDNDDVISMLEVGCGAGNFLFPILERYPILHAYACDFSPRAVKLVTENPSFDNNRIVAFVHDISQSSLTNDVTNNNHNDSTHSLSLSQHLKNQKIDIVVCLFVLSSIPPEKHAQTLQNLIDVLRPPSECEEGGYLLFRDYALGDPAQNRFHTRKSASYSDPSLLSSEEPLYRRSDGTLSYFFTSEQIHVYLSDGLGLQGECTIAERPMSNRKEGIDLTRKFVHGIYRKVR